MKTAKVAAIYAVFVFSVTAFLTHGFAQEKPKFDVSETQTLRLKVQALQFAAASEHYQNAIASFNAEIKAVEKENGWKEDDVQFHPDTLTFTPAAKRPEPPVRPSLDKPAGSPVEPATRVPVPNSGTLPIK